MTFRADRLGTLAWLLLVAALVWLLVTPAPGEDDAHRPVQTLVVRPGAPVDFVLPPDTREVKVLTIAEHPATRTVDLTRDLPYTIVVGWLDGDDAPLTAEHLSLASGVAVSPPYTSVAADGSALPVAKVADSPVLAPRTTLLPVPDRARVVRLSVPDEGPAVRVRVYRAEPAPLETPELALLRVDERDATTFTRQLRLASWDEVTIDEALALAALRWAAINPRRTTLPPGASVVTMLPYPALPESVRRATGVSLHPGGARAWTLTGPLDVWIVADGPLDRATFQAIVRDVGEVGVSVAAERVPRWRPDATAVRITTTVAGETSLHLTLPADVGLERVMALLPPAQAASLPETVEAVPASSFVRGVADVDLVSVVPPHTDLRQLGPRIDRPLRFFLPDAPTRGVVRLTLRPVGVPAAALARAEAVVVYADHQDVQPLSVEMIPSAYERAWPPVEACTVVPTLCARGDGATVGEPVERFVRVGPGAQHLDLRIPADEDPGVHLLASAALPGPQRGARVAWDDLRATTVRYQPDARTPWSPLEPVPVGATPASEPLWVVRANPRREVRGDGDGLVGDRRFRPLDPPPTRSGLPGETWLLPPRPGEAAAGLGWCELRPGEVSARFGFPADVAARLGGTMLAVIAAPGARANQPTLGDAVDIRLGGQPWYDTQLRTAVTSHAAHTDPVDTASFLGPEGARLWLRADLERARCQRPWLARRVVDVRPGETVVWWAERESDAQLLVLGGIAPDMVQLDVELGGGTPQVVPDDAWTLRSRSIELSPDGRIGVALETPWLDGRVLAPEAMLLRADLPRRVEVRVTSRASATVRLYAAIEAVGATPSAPRTDAPRRLPQ